MKAVAIPLDDLPRQEELPSQLVEDGGELWQRGHRLVDQGFDEFGRITAGSWQSGRFATKPFVFGGCEWLSVLSGRILFETEGRQHEIGEGMAALLPRGTHCRWIQPEPVLKYFLRWDYEGADQPRRFWSSAMGERPFAAGTFAATTDSASWLKGASSVTLQAARGVLELAGDFTRPRSVTRRAQSDGRTAERQDTV